MISFRNSFFFLVLLFSLIESKPGLIIDDETKIPTGKTIYATRSVDCELFTLSEERVTSFGQFHRMTLLEIDAREKSIEENLIRTGIAFSSPGSCKMTGLGILHEKINDASIYKKIDIFVKTESINGILMVDVDDLRNETEKIKTNSCQDIFISNDTMICKKTVTDTLYILDSIVGNIWRIIIKNDKPTLDLWIDSVKSRSTKSYLVGAKLLNPEFLYQDNAIGSKFGENPLDSYIYASNDKLQLSFRIKIMPDGSAAKEELLWESLFEYVWE